MLQRSVLVLIMHAEPDTGTVRIRPAQKGFGSGIRSDPGPRKRRRHGTVLILPGYEINISRGFFILSTHNTGVNFKW
jgi:hypothetical protein